MKSFRIIMASVAVLMMTASCLDSKDAYNAGFVFRKPVYVVNAYFANNLVDTISFISYGKWAVNRDITANWCSINTLSGHGNTYYSFPVTFTQNTTGEGRAAKFTFSDTDHPGDASATIAYWQYATRGDGTMGSAPDVKAIVGSDGSRFELTYDAQHRPLSLSIAKEGVQLRSLKITYHDADSTLTVLDGSKTLTSKFANDYQPKRLIGGGDTICYASQFYSNGFPISAENAFNLEHYTSNGNNSYYAFLLGGQSLQPDSLHTADSLRIARRIDGQMNVRKYKLDYSANDNRYQTVDANQLVFGTEQCDPYQLLSLFRYCRSSRIVSEVSDGTVSLQVESQLNADRSVRQLTVRTVSGGVAVPDIPLTYTFEY